MTERSGLALRQGSALKAWAEGRTRGKPKAPERWPGEASLAPHPAAEPVRTYLFWNNPSNLVGALWIGEALDVALKTVALLNVGYLRAQQITVR